MISPVTSRKRILLVGAGRRIQNNFLPALSCLNEHFDVCGLHSRTSARLLPVAGKWGVVAVENLAAFDFSSVDMVAISVPTAQNAPVLRQLAPFAASLDIVIDTPVAWTAAERAESMPLLQQFRNVTVAEDYMNFPQFELVRQAVRGGLIGRVRRITLNNIGYLYHGLALIRSFVGFGPVRRAPRIVLHANAHLVSYEFADDVVGHVIGPYRRHSTGGLFIEGEAGFISEFPYDREAATSRPTYMLGQLRKDGKLTGFRLAGKGHDSAIDLPDLRRMADMEIADKSDINLMRGCGLISVLRSAAGEHNINAAYGFKNAYYDAFVSARADQGMVPLDPFDSFPSERPQISLAPPRWVSTANTVLKRKPVLSASLQPDEKMEIAEGTALTAAREEAEANHVKLYDVCLQGKPLGTSPWYIFRPHWVR